MFSDRSFVYRIITIPESVTRIGVNAFNGCSALDKMSVSNGNTAFDSRNNCNSIIDSTTGILLYDCRNLKSIEIPARSVISIGEYAFNGYGKTVIVGTQGSASETFAKEQHLPFVVIGRYDPNQEYKVDITGTTIVTSVPGFKKLNSENSKLNSRVSKLDSENNKLSSEIADLQKLLADNNIEIPDK